MHQKPDWAGLCAIGMVKSSVLEKEVLREETRYFITSLTDVSTLAKAVRGHWGIENSLHWVLDVAFREDNCRIALNLLKKDDAKMSMKAKRHRCAYEEEYLWKVLFTRCP